MIETKRTLEDLYKQLKKEYGSRVNLIFTHMEEQEKLSLKEYEQLIIQYRELLDR